MDRKLTHQQVWDKKSRAQKIRYFDALGKLFGKSEEKHDAEVPEKRNPIGVDDEIG